MTSPAIDDITAQINALKGIAQPQPVAPTFTIDQVQEMIKRATADGYQAGFERVKAFLPVVEKPKTTLDMINATFTQDEQTWFCSPVVLAGIDSFLVDYMDDEKLSVLRKCFDSFKEYHESKN